MRRRNYLDLDKFASFSLLDSPPKNMSELMDLALPNLLTASELLLGPVDTGAGDLLGLTNCVLSLKSRTSIVKLHNTYHR